MSITRACALTGWSRATHYRRADPAGVRLGPRPRSRHAGRPASTTLTRRTPSGSLADPSHRTCPRRHGSTSPFTASPVRSTVSSDLTTTAVPPRSRCVLHKPREVLPATSRRPGTTSATSTARRATPPTAGPTRSTSASATSLPAVRPYLIMANARAQRPRRGASRQATLGPADLDQQAAGRSHLGTGPPYRNPQEQTARRRQRGRWD